MKTPETGLKVTGATPQRQLQPQTPTTRQASSPKLLLGALITTGGVSLLVGGALLGHGPHPAPDALASPVTSAAPVGSARAGTDVAYTPSKFTGVMVRHVPSAATPGSGAQKGWIYLKPGAKLSGPRRRYSTRGGVTYELGKTTAGGIIAHVNPNFYPYAVARLKPAGQVPGGAALRLRSSLPAKPQAHVEIQY